MQGANVNILKEMKHDYVPVDLYHKTRLVDSINYVISVLETDSVT